VRLSHGGELLPPAGQARVIAEWRAGERRVSRNKIPAGLCDKRRDSSFVAIYEKETAPPVFDSLKIWLLIPRPGQRNKFGLPAFLVGFVEPTAA
jgi:hypothetical protein